MAKIGEKERSQKDLEKLDGIISYFKSKRFSSGYCKQLEYAMNYSIDALHYHEKGDYFTSFGCANYAYGILEGVLLKETGKTFHELEQIGLKKGKKK